MVEEPNQDDDIEKASSAIFELITQEQIDQTINLIRAGFDTDLNGVQINSAKPGEDIFDRYEIQNKLLHACNSDFEELQAKIKSYGFDPNAISTDDLRKIAAKESVTLEGKLPGFTLTAGDDEIIFFAINGTNAIEMANRYASKESESGISFDTPEEAITYLKTLAIKALFHEIAHIIYARGNFKEWNDYIQKHPKIRDRVIEIQQDKYGDADQIPVDEEAFADFAIEVLSNGELISRLGKNDEAVNIIRSLIKRRPSH